MTAAEVQDRRDNPRKYMSESQKKEWDEREKKWKALQKETLDKLMESMVAIMDKRGIEMPDWVYL